MEPYPSYATFDERVPLVSLCGKRGSHNGGFSLDKSIEYPICQVVAELRAKHLPPSQSMQVFEGIEVTTPGAFGGWEQVRQQHHIVCWISSIGAVIVYWGWKGTMATQSEILSDNFMFIRGEQLTECLADESERMKVSDAGKCKYPDLNLDGEVPRG